VVTCELPVLAGRVVVLGLLTVLVRSVVVRLTCGDTWLLVVLLELLRLTCGVVVVLRPVVLLELLRLTCGAVVVLRPVVALLELVRLTCGVAWLLRLLALLELLRVTCGAVEVLVRETAADWLLLLVLPP
jgi:hypothetical protein